MNVPTAIPRSRDSTELLTAYQFSPEQVRRLAELGISIGAESSDAPSQRNGHAAASPGGFSVAEYQRMIDAAILHEDERLELLEGMVVVKMPSNPPHNSSVSRTIRRLERVLPAGWICRAQMDIVCGEQQPAPDVSAVRGPEERYDRRHPDPADVGMLVEVADSSLAIDREIKGPLYARGRVPIYWIVNIPDRQVEVYSEPTGSGAQARYQGEQIYLEGQSVPVTIAGNRVGEIPVNELLPAKTN